MTINLPEELVSTINAEVLRRHCASPDDLVTEIVRDYFERNQQPSSPQQPVARQEATAQEHKPIWEIIEEENRSIPPEVWDALPTDLAEQHDHYIYGTPKRTDA